MLLSFSNFFIFLLLLITTGFISFNVHFIKLWVGENFYLGTFFNILLSLYFFTSTLSYIFSNFCYSLGKIKEVSIFDFIKNFIYLSTIIVCGYYKGIIGILISVLFLSLSSEFWYYPRLLVKELNIKFQDIKDQTIRLIIIFLLFILLAFIFSKFHIDSYLIFITYCLIYITISAIFYLYLFPDTKDFVQTNIIKRRNKV